MHESRKRFTESGGAYEGRFVGLISSKRISVFYMAINNVRKVLKYFRMPYILTWANPVK